MNAELIGGNQDRYLWANELSALRRIAANLGGPLADKRARIFVPDHPSNGGYVRNVVQRAIVWGLQREVRAVFRRFDQDRVSNRPMLGEIEELTVREPALARCLRAPTYASCTELCVGS